MRGMVFDTLPVNGNAFIMDEVSLLTNKNFRLGVSRWNTWIDAGAEGFYLPESDEVSWKLTGHSVSPAIENKVKTNEIALIVTRFISGSAGKTNGTALLWVNPVLDETEPTLDSAVSVSTNGVRAFEFVSIMSQGNSALISVVTNIPGPGVTNIINTYETPPKVKYDEIRFGDSWMGVTGVPEPCLTFLTFGLIFAALGLRKQHDRFC